MFFIETVLRQLFSQRDVGGGGGAERSSVDKEHLVANGMRLFFLLYRRPDFNLFGVEGRV